MNAGRDLFDHKDEILTLLRHGSSGLFTDIDGTLAPIVSDPRVVIVPGGTRTALEQLASKISVIVVSGRDVSAAREILGIETLVYSGNHGAEWLEHGIRRTEPLAAPYLERMHSLAIRAATELGLEGLYIEDKGSSVSIHYRNVARPGAARDTICAFVEHADRALEIREGKFVVEIRPPVELSKGHAIRALVERDGLANVMMMGDDATDIDAFEALSQLRSSGKVRGVNVAVLASDAPVGLGDAADYVLQGPAEVQRFLIWLAAQL